MSNRGAVSRTSLCPHSRLCVALAASCHLTPPSPTMATVDGLRVLLVLSHAL